MAPDQTGDLHCLRINIRLLYWYPTMTDVDLCAKSRYQGEGQVITSHIFIHKNILGNVPVQNGGHFILAPCVEICISCQKDERRMGFGLHCFHVLCWDTSKPLPASICVALCDWPEHDDVIKWKHFPRYWPFVRGIHRSPGDFPAQRPVTRSFDVWINGWVNNHEAGDLRRYRAHYDVMVMGRWRSAVWCSPPSV